LFATFASVALLESLSLIILPAASRLHLLYSGNVNFNFHTTAKKLSRLTISALAIFFGATLFATIALLEPVHGMDALAMDVTAARSSVKVANHAHLV
jgi:hypothetical protein